MTKKRNKTEKAIDTEMIRHFMLDGVDFKDAHSPSKPAAEVDLHLDETTKEYDFLSDGEKLNIQLRHLEKQIDRAIANGSKKIDVIHGKGEGRLKAAVDAYLKKHPQVKSFRVLTGKKHDGGATEVIFK
jgi:dsDNA-specific endonuclease/ATPase MutS2